MDRNGLHTELGRAADRLFHTIILEATGNELLISLSGSIGAVVRWTTHYKHRSAKLPRDSMPEHRKLFATIADTNAAAARAVTIVLVHQAREDTERAPTR